MEPKAFVPRLLGMVAYLCALFLVFAPVWAGAGTFQINAAVDRTDLELGDTLQFTLNLTVDGSLTFQPTVATPIFEGFDAQGPNQSYSSSWVNGASTLVYSWTWQLEAQKPGRWVLGPFHASAKDALNGNIDRATAPIVVTVRRPRGLNYPLPAGAVNSAQQDQEPDPDSGSLRGIKPDRGIPWALMAEVFGALLAFLSLLAWLAQHNPPKVLEETLPADPAQAAMARLDRAMQALLASADGRIYAVSVGEALRLYLRQRLDLRAGSTLGEAIRGLRLQAPHVLPQRVGLLRQRLELLLYGGSEFRPEDRELLDLDARAVIRGFETARTLSSEQQSLSKTLDRMAALWKEGQAKSAWMGMRSATLDHLRKSLGLGPGPLPRGALARVLRPLDAPELMKMLDALQTDQAPRGNTADALAGRLLRLVQVLDAMDRNLLHGGEISDQQDHDPPRDGSSPEDQGEA